MSKLQSIVIYIASKLHSKLQGAKTLGEKKVEQGERNQACWGRGGGSGQPYQEHDIWVNP